MFRPHWLAFFRFTRGEEAAIVALKDRRLAGYKKTLRHDGEVVRIAHKNDLLDRREITVQIDGNRQVDDSDRTFSTNERMQVFCLSDQDDADFGGISNPVEGLHLFRSQGPRQEVPYSFSGEIASSDEGHWVLIFERAKLSIQSRGRMG